MKTARGQGAIEYLLIIGAAILVVAIVILAVTGVLSGGTAGLDQGKTTINSQTAVLRCQADINAFGPINTAAACSKESAITKANCKCCSTTVAVSGTLLFAQTDVDKIPRCK